MGITVSQQISTRAAIDRPKMLLLVISLTFIQGLLAQQCYDLGGCQKAPLLGAVTVESTNQCLKVCKDTSGCE